MERSLSWVVRKKTEWRGASKRERKGKGGRRVAEWQRAVEGVWRGEEEERETYTRRDI